MWDNVSFTLIELIIMASVAMFYMLSGIYALVSADDFRTARGWPTRIPEDPLRGIGIWMAWPLVALWWLTEARFYESPRQRSRWAGRGR